MNATVIVCYAHHDLPNLLLAVGEVVNLVYAVEERVNHGQNLCPCLCQCLHGPLSHLALEGRQTPLSNVLHHRVPDQGPMVLLLFPIHHLHDQVGPQALASSKRPVQRQNP